MAASSGIMLLLVVPPCPLLELACSLLAWPCIFTCPLSCVPPLVSPDTAIAPLDSRGKAFRLESSRKVSRQRS